MLTWLTALLFSCGLIPEYRTRDYIAAFGNSDSWPYQFYFCYSHNCRETVLVHLSDDEWDRIRGIFVPQPVSAQEERELIRKSVSTFELIVGKHTGTDVDKGGTFSGIFRHKQLDCIDEAVNTGTYLSMMHREGLIVYHSLGQIAQRGYLVNGQWHVAPALLERNSGKAYVVDSWFLDNGKPPFIISLEEWKSGWTPERLVHIPEESL